MIRSFKDTFTEDLFHGIDTAKTRKVPRNIKSVAVRKMDQLDAAIDISDMKAPPGNRLEKLKGDFKEYYSIRINDQYRIIFQWNNSQASNVSVTDYH
ncbi:MAG: type II toxin-antitoxin system RelE/ParE family toxin [Leptospirales bacterium]